MGVNILEESLCKIHVNNIPHIIILTIIIISMVNALEQYNIYIIGITAIAYYRIYCIERQFEGFVKYLSEILFNIQKDLRKKYIPHTFLYFMCLDFN